MELKILKDEKSKLVVELKGEDNTLANAVKDELWNDSHIKAAGYYVKHPLSGYPRLTVETDGKEEPKKALMEAAKRLKKSIDKFKADVKKEIK